MIVDPDKEYWIQYRKGWSHFYKGESRLVSLGAKVAPSLNGVDLSFQLSCLILLVEPSGSNILHDRTIMFVVTQADLGSKNDIKQNVLRMSL